MRSLLLVSLLFCGMARANPVEAPSKSWKALRSKNIQMDFSEERVEEAIAACRSAGLSIAEAEDLFCPVYDAYSDRLPTDCIFLKIEEGLAKGVSWKTVHKAADQRLVCLREADRLILEVRSRRGGQHAHLVSHTCLAIESGLSSDALSALFSRPGRFRYGRLIHAIEAGESLKLAGLSNEDALLIMNECLDRDLTGAEIFRVVNILKVGLRNGVDFEDMHPTLWISTD